MAFYDPKTMIQYNLTNTKMDKFLSVGRIDYVDNHAENISKGSPMLYENIIDAMETSQNIRENRLKPENFSNFNARYLSTVSGMKQVAAVLECVSCGIQIGQDRKWKRVDEQYKTHYGILPVVAFSNVSDTLKFIELLKIEHPSLKHVGYTKLQYSKLALNDLKENFSVTKTWDRDFVEDVMINICLGGGYQIAINTPFQRQVLTQLNDIKQIPEIARIDMFIDYCRRTAPKVEK